MKQCVLTVYIPDNSVRDSVHIAQMMREAAANLEYQIPLEDHQHVYGPAGAHKYEWTVSDPAAPIDQAKAKDRARERRVGAAAVTAYRDER